MSPAGDENADRPFAWRPIALRVLFFGGLALCISLVLRELPREQTLVFRVERTVTELDASWTREGHGEPLGGVKLTFRERAPRHVRHQFSSPNGDYSLAIRLRGERGDPETTYSRRVTLTGDETVVPLLPE